MTQINARGLCPRPRKPWKGLINTDEKNTKVNELIGEVKALNNLKCERLVDMEFEEKLSDEFIAEVKESEEAYERGEYIEVKDREEREKEVLMLALM